MKAEKLNHILNKTSLFYLKTVMLYNKRASLIEIYVERYKLSGDLVEQKVQEAAREMVMRGCPDVTRETLTPFIVKDVPQGKNSDSGIGQNTLRSDMSYILSVCSSLCQCAKLGDGGGGGRAPS